MSTKVRDFTVEGSGQFPFDMLRYDLCWPKAQVDSAQLAAVAALPHANHTYRVELTTVGNVAPTAARWASFGWKVLTS